MTVMPKVIEWNRKPEKWLKTAFQLVINDEKNKK